MIAFAFFLLAFIDILIAVGSGFTLHGAAFIALAVINCVLAFDSLSE